MNSLIKSAAPSQQPENTIAIQDAFAQRGGSHFYWRIKPMEMTCRGIGRLSPIAIAFHINESWQLSNTVLARVPEAAL